MSKTRRADNEGSIYFDRKLSRFVGQFRYTDPQTGERKRKKITNKRKSAVVQQGREFIAENVKAIKRKQEGKTDGSVLLGEYMSDWLEHTAKPSIRQKTYERYECTLRRYIMPNIGNTLLSELTRNSLQQFLSKLSMQGNKDGGALAPSTVNAVRRLIKTALDMAVADNLLKVNVANVTKAMKVTKKQISVFSREEYQKLLSAAKDHSDRAYLVIRIAFATGFRIGEIFGLEYSNVDFDKNMISIKQTVVTAKHGKCLQGMAKNASSLRSIKVEQKLIDELKFYKHKHEQRKLLYGNKYEQEHDFIIENEDGSFCDPAYFTDKIFKRQLLKKAGLPSHYRMHDCRHTHATWLISKGVNIKAVSERLGHKSIRTTLDTYAHITKSMQDEAVKALEDILSEK